MPHQKIICAADPLLAVYIDRENPAALVVYEYDDRGEQPTQYQTADMPMDDQAAASMVNDWLA